MLISDVETKVGLSSMSETGISDSTYSSRTYLRLPPSPSPNNSIDAGRANQALRHDWLKHLEMVKSSIGFNYVRFHALFHDDMFVIKMKIVQLPVY